MPDPSNAGDRTKAYRLRKAKKAGQALMPVDALWLAEYDENQEKREAKKKAQSVGASRSSSGRKINFQLEEQAEAEAVGTGTAAAAAAAAALREKEEGRRLDSLTINAVDALKEAVAVYRDIALVLRERTEVLEHTHVEMLQSVRAHFIAATQAESALMQRDQEKDPASAMLMMLLAKRFGIDLPPGYTPPQPPPGARRPPPNGAPPNGTPPSK